MIDVVVIGAGPGGLSAALALARSGRETLLLDGGPWRNASAETIHNLVTRDGATGADLRTAALEQLNRYPTVKVQQASANAVSGTVGKFEVQLDNGRTVTARRLLLATGIEDILPEIPGLAERWGRSVLHCPYCHGWEQLGLPLAVLASDAWSVHQAAQVSRYSGEVYFCTNADPSALNDDQRRQLKDRGVAIRDEALASLEGPGTSLQRVVFTNGDPLACRALFCHTGARQRSDLPERLGCTLLDDGAVQVNELHQTSVPGVYAVGDMAHEAGRALKPHQVVVAAAEGLAAAIVVDQELLYSN
jgi:thioredoxin reductase